MTIGISKERLEELFRENPCFFERELIEWIIAQCTELNTWLPIEKAPKSKPLLLWHEPSEQTIIACSNYPNCTHYQELPGDPD